MGMNMEPVPTIGSEGTQVWRVNRTSYHRLDGPAIIWANGTQEWWVNDLRHRTSGPAIIWANGTQSWYVNGKDITEEVEKWLEERTVSWPWPDEETRVEFLLTWAT